MKIIQNKDESYNSPVRKDFLPAFQPFIENEEINEVIDSLKSGWITTGPKTHEFEVKFKEYVGCEASFAISSCTAALHLSLVINEIGKNDEVITTPFTFISTANVIVHQHSKPIFVDINPDTYNINVEKIEENITEKTKAIIPVHYGGHPCEMDEILKIAQENNLTIIEDAAHAMGAEYKNNKIGNIGDLTCFSFYATKNLTTAEGGMITTNNLDFSEKINVMRLHGMSKDAWKRYSSKGSWYYEVVSPGYKYNMTDIQAAIGIHQLKKLKKMQDRRKEIAQIYNESLNDISEIIIPHPKPYVKNAWHLYPIRLVTNQLRINRAEFIELLKKENIGTSVHFIPVHMHPYYKKTYGYSDDDFPISKSLYEQEISIPLYPKMTDKDVLDVIEAIKKIINKNRR